MIKSGSIAAAIFGASSLAMCGAALALDAEEFADAFSAMVAQSDFFIEFEAVRSEGDTIILNGVNAAPEGKDLKSFDVELVFTGVKETIDGDYTADRGSIARFEFAEDDVIVTANDLVWEHVVISTRPVEDPFAAMQQPSGYSAGRIVVNIKGEDVFSIESISAGGTPNATQTEVGYSFSVNGIHADLAAIDDDEAREVFDAFGITALDARIVGENVWDIDNGRLAVRQSSFEIDKIGRFNTAFSLLGYDEAFVRTLFDLQQNAEADGADVEEMGMGVFKAMLDALFLEEASFRFDDDGITNKVLDYFAEQQDTPRAMMTIGLAAALPMLAVEAGAPEALQIMLLEAATSFMGQPQSLEVSVSPEKPLRFSRVLAAVEDEDAQALIQMLNPSIVANN